MKFNATLWRVLLASTLLLIAHVFERAHAQSKPAADNSVIAIRNAKIVTVSGETIPKGTLLIKDGKIALETPQDTRVLKTAKLDQTGYALVLVPLSAEQATGGRLQATLSPPHGVSATAKTPRAIELTEWREKSQ